MHLQEKNQSSDYEELVSSFILLHKSQFQACGLPEIYWRELCFKLKDEVIKKFNLFLERLCLNFLTLYYVVRYLMLVIFFKFAKELMKMIRFLVIKQFV